jgi:RNA polymerase-binding transcription factor DksA
MDMLPEQVRNRIFEPALVSEAKKGDRHDQASAQGTIAIGVRIADQLNKAKREDESEERVRKALGKEKAGICVTCEKPISKARLEARPFATQCLSCKAKTTGDKTVFSS